MCTTKRIIAIAAAGCGIAAVLTAVLLRKRKRI